MKIFDERFGLSPTQKKLKKQGYYIPNFKVKVGYKSSEPVRIVGKGKVKFVDTCHITVKESKDSEGGEKDRSQRSSIFYRITSSVTNPSVFQRLRTPTLDDKNQEDEVDVAGCGHVEVKEAFDHERFEEDVEATPLSLEDGSQSTIDELKEVNLVRKKNGKLRVCVDFRDLNNACPKDDFPLPIMEIMIDATTGHEALSFMDGSSGYNQIQMTLDDEEKTSFQTPKGQCQPFQRLVRKDAVFDWNQSCQNAFNSIKKPVISGSLTKWAIKFQEYDIVYNPQKAVKGQALEDFLADHQILSNWELYEDLPDEEVLFVESLEPWTMFFDGATRRSGAGVNIVFITLEKHMFPYSFTLGELCSNNIVEYQALIIGLQMASKFGINYIEIFGDLKLIINQLSYQYEEKHQDLKPYFIYARRLMDRFDGIILKHILRSENKKVDALANLAIALTVLEDVLINISLCQKWIMPSIESQYKETDVISVNAIDEED
ncbi:uncharacterized protein E5676_scaffold863G001650 [Cucumis melo var. makuwa]|uniref:RNase H type-1 domain-containing protein n=1 Tax=Cucumis melo var. makuwa TaxID=1194695 RepID=A0A5D3BWA1_CUCMM|nr:uncharacterized protein E6C27_scaffold348G00210 [Cucumis melo var. makuwa]TYK03777.1 uncharacterized protein E5676_scaffold863G001650 [Cucumis melo var. makuwa]